MKLSIITINLNNVSGLRDTLNSVKKQSFRDFEWIVVDGDSQDGSKELIEQNTQFITKWVSEKDTGIYNAMNKGSRMASGDYVMYLNSGDQLFDAHTLSVIFEKDHTADIMFGNIVVSDDPNCIPRGQMTDKFSIFSQLTIVPVPHPASFFKREFIKSMSFYDESYKILGDSDLFFRSIFINNCTLEYLGVVVNIFDSHGISSGGVEGYDIMGEGRKLYAKNLPRFFGFDHPSLYRLQDVKKAMRIRDVMMKYKITKWYFQKHANVSENNI